MQNSGVIPHWPQTSQQAFNGHGFISAQSHGEPELGFVVPGTCRSSQIEVTGTRVKDKGRSTNLWAANVALDCRREGRDTLTKTNLSVSV